MNLKQCSVLLYFWLAGPLLAAGDHAGFRQVNPASDPSNTGGWVLSQDMSDDFRVYGCEWNRAFLRFYAEGKLVRTITKAELGERWVLTHPLWVWVDSETFPSHGLPAKADLPVDFEIEYIRIWQSK